MYVYYDLNSRLNITSVKPELYDYFEIPISDIPKFPNDGGLYRYKADIVNKKIFVIPEESKHKSPDELTLLKAQLQAMTERNEFIEDVIAEMAMEVYKTV